MGRQESIIRTGPRRSGANPNCILLAGHGPGADRLRRALERHWIVRSLDASRNRVDGGVYIEAAGDQRHEQLAALRQISALAPDGAVIISTSPILANREIAASVTNPSRLVTIAPPWSSRSQVCELVVSPRTMYWAVDRAFDIVRSAGWRALFEADGGPSALTRLYGAVVIQSWNLARATGRPRDIDRAARQAGLTWSPLREVDCIGLPRVGAIFSRAEQVGEVDSIYLSASSDEPSESFRTNCGNGLVEEPVAIGYFLDAAIEAAASVLADRMVDRRALGRFLAVAYGHTVGRRVSRALRARYPEMTSGASLTAPA